MQEQGPKRRSTQLGIGQSGLHPRTDESLPASPRSTEPSAASPPVHCPSPSAPPRRTASGEHGTVEFAGEPVTRARSRSFTDEDGDRAREEAARSDSVRARMSARRPTEPAIERVIPPPASVSGRHRGDPARDPREEADPQGGREPRVDVFGAVRQETPRSTGRPDTLSSRGEGPVSSPPATSRQPPSGSGRAAVRVDDVGANAVRLATRATADATPKVLVQRRALASAPIDHREAFLVSLIDGTLTVSALVDVSGMPAAEVTTALQRLARLGIVSL